MLMSSSHPALFRLFTLNCETALLTHRLPAMVCFDTLSNVVAGSCFKFLQGFQQFVLLPGQKDDTLSSSALSVVPDLHLSGERWLSTATLINNSSRSEGVYTINLSLYYLL